MDRLAQERAQQIAEMTQQIPMCTTIYRGELYEAPLRLADGMATKLSIRLPSNFPQGRPILSLAHPVRHPWMQAGGRLSFRSLDQWRFPGSRLAPVVQEAFAGLSGQRVSPGSASAGASASRAPSVPDSFPELEAKTHEELTALLTDDAKYAELVRDIMTRSHVTQLKSQLKAGNLSLAHANLGKESEIRELRNQIAIIRSSDYAVAKEAFDGKYARQQAVMAKLRPDRLVESLTNKTNEAEAKSEEIQEAFMQGGCKGIEAFVDSYLRERTLYHQRDLKRQSATQAL